MTAGQTQKTCPSCGTVNRPDCQFCTGCGKAFRKERTCPRCSATLSGSQRFCSACGAPADAGNVSPGSGQMKFCHQCRALISRDAKFCNTCGAAFSNMPVCPRCGDPIGPQEKFCGVCGMPFTPSAPSRPIPVQPGQQPVAAQRAPQMVPAPATMKKSRISLGKVAAIGVVIFVILVAVVMLLPEPTTPPPPTTGGGLITGGISVPSGEDPVATQKGIDGSNSVVQKASQELAAGNAAGFTSCLASEYRSAVTGSSLNPQNSAAVSAALKTARVISAYPGIVYYEMSMGNTKYSFYTVEEEGSWKIAGL